MTHSEIVKDELILCLLHLITTAISLLGLSDSLALYKNGADYYCLGNVNEI